MKIMHTRQFIRYNEMACVKPNRTPLSLCTLALAGLAGILLTSSAQGDIWFNNGAGTLDFGVPENWSGGLGPTVDQGRNLIGADGGAGGTPYVVSLNQMISTVGELQIGIEDNVYGSGGNPGGAGQLMLESGADLTLGGALVIGQGTDSTNNNSGVVTVKDGANLTIGSAAVLVGFYHNSASVQSSGTLNVDGGTINHGGMMVIGGWENGDTNLNYGVGVLNLNSGFVNVSKLNIGRDNGRGTVVQNGGSLEVGDYMAVGIGYNTGSTNGVGNYFLKDGSLTVQNDFSVNESGAPSATTNSSTFDQSGGSVTLNSSGLICIGRAGTGGGYGIYNLSGGTLTDAGGTSVLVGGNNTGSKGILNISGTGQLFIDGTAGLALARSANSSGTVNQTGGAVEISSVSSFGVSLGLGGDGTTATYNLKGGNLTTPQITADGGTGVKVFNFDGGKLIANGAISVASVPGFSTVINASGAVVDPCGFNIIWNPSLLAGTGTGGLSVVDSFGGGSIELNGTNTYVGSTVISNCMIAGSGSFLGALTIGADATLSPGGTEIGAIVVSNNVVLKGTTTMDLGRSGVTAMCDQLLGVHTLTLGGTLIVETNGSLTAFAPGDTFQLFGASAFSSKFESVSLPTLPDGWSWDTSKISVTGTIKVVGSVSDVTFISQPSSLTLSVGDNGFFVTSVVGSTPIRYQWYFNDSPLDGETNSSLSVSNVHSANVGNYYLVASNSTSVATSSVVSLSLSIDLLLAYEPFDYNAGNGNLVGQSGGFGWAAPWQTVNGSGEAIASGSLIGDTNVPTGYDALSIGNSAYLPTWQRDGRYLDISSGGSFDANGYLNANGNIGAEGKTLYVSFLQQPNVNTSFYEFEFHRLDLGDGGRVGGVGNDTGDAYVYLRTPAVNQKSIGPGNTNVNFYVVRIDFKGGNDSVRVYQNPILATEPSTPTLLQDNAGDMSFNGISFGAFLGTTTVRHDEVRIGTSWAAVVGKPSGPPVVLMQPHDASVYSGADATFSVKAGGSAPFTYYWQKDGAFYQVSTNSTLTLSKVQLGDAGSIYSVIVSNEFGSFASSEATLNVLEGMASISLSATPTETKFGSNVTLTASLSQQGASGTIVFWEGDISLFKIDVADGNATFTTKALAIGTHALKATYSGDSTFGAATSSVVNVQIVAGTNSLPSGVVAYYPFDSSTIDASGKGNHLQSAVALQFSYGAGPFGGDAIYLDGMTTLSTVTGAFPIGVPTGANPYTVACFVLADASSINNGGWIGYGSQGNKLCNNFRMDGFSRVWNYWWNADFGAAVPDGGDFTSAWHAVVGTWDGTTRNLYIDGQLVNSDTPGAPSITTDTFRVGTTMANENFTGWLCDLMIANRALNETEVVNYSTSGAISAPAMPSEPTNIIFNVSGNLLTMTWPSAYEAWILQVQTNSLTTGIGTNWVDLGPISGTTTNVPLNVAPAVFYRLRHP